MSRPPAFTAMVARLTTTSKPWDEIELDAMQAVYERTGYVTTAGLVNRRDGSNAVYITPPDLPDALGWLSERLAEIPDDEQRCRLTPDQARHLAALHGTATIPQRPIPQRPLRMGYGWAIGQRR